MAHTKAGGSSHNGRDSNAKRLGVKVHDGNPVTNGSIIAKQRGNNIYPGKNVKRGKDDTVYATKDGVIKFSTKHKTSFQGKIKKITVVDII
jgi:large subunit ribosomal protein L27